MVEAEAHAVVDVFAGYVGRAVVVSSMDVYRAYDVLLGREENPQPVPVSEESELRVHLFPYRGKEERGPDDPQRWQDDYDKIPVERIFLDEDRLKATVLRLPAVYGPRDRQHRFRDVARRLADDRHDMVVDEEFAHWRFTHGYVENVAGAITLAATTDASSGIFNVGEKESPTREEWLRRVFDAAGWNGHVVIVPASVLPDELKVTGLNLYQDMACDCSKIRQELGFSEPVEWDEGVKRTIQWEIESLRREADYSDTDYAAEDEVLTKLRP
jgi:nucleoside-diphosphate-sugar epimerase